MGFSVLQYVISQMRMYDIEDEIKKKKKKKKILTVASVSPTLICQYLGVIALCL